MYGARPVGTNIFIFIMEMFSICFVEVVIEVLPTLYLKHFHECQLCY